MKVIGVTGGIACGKTTLVKALRARGAFIIDADAISRQLTTAGGPALPAIRNAFGARVFTSQGELDRKALGEVIFGDENKRQALNAIIHPMVLKEMERQLALARAGGEPAVILDVPLLFEAHMDGLCDQVWCACLKEPEQIKRLMARDHLTKEQALQRIQSQMPLEEKKALADRVIDTSGTEEESARIILSLYENALKEPSWKIATPMSDKRL